MWSVVGGSAADLFGVRADYALPIAGVALAIFSLQRPDSATTVMANGELVTAVKS